MQEFVRLAEGDRKDLLNLVISELEVLADLQFLGSQKLCDLCPFLLVSSLLKILHERDQEDQTFYDLQAELRLLLHELLAKLLQEGGFVVEGDLFLYVEQRILAVLLVLDQNPQIKLVLLSGLRQP